ncbi:MAG TPA: hypothetical protein VLB27_07280 [candidate division Zixibacteria bacterium]|nr:hypothetical protein [candidate division Zixibacteria bacterium]
MSGIIQTKKLTLTPGSVRGRIGSGFDPRVVTELGCAFATLAGHGPIVVGRDGRMTGEHYARSVISAMNSLGREVYALGIVPSATLAVAARELGCAGAISITPGPLPESWSGLRFFDRNGQTLSAKSFTRLMQLARAGKFKLARAERIGKFKMDYSCLGRHIQRVTEIPAINLMNINRAQFSAVVDCANAGAAAVLPDFLRCIGVRVTELNCLPGHPFPHTPDIGAAAMKALSAEVKKRRADLGIIADADGSRIGLVDEKGAVVAADKTQALALRQAVRAHTGSIGAPAGATLARKLAKQLEVKVWTTPADEPSAYTALRAKRSALALGAGGELWYAYGSQTADALVTAALALSDIAEARQPLSRTVAELV